MYLMGHKGPEVGEVIDADEFYKTHIAPKLDDAISTDIESTLQRTLRDILVSVGQNDLEFGDPTSIVFGLAGRVRFEALQQVRGGRNMDGVHQLLQVSHQIGRIDPQDADYLAQLSTADLRKLAKEAWRNQNVRMEIEVREKLCEKEEKTYEILYNFLKLSNLYYATGQTQKAVSAKLAALRHMDAIQGNDDIEAAKRFIRGMKMTTLYGLRRLVNQYRMVGSEILLRQTALEDGLDEPGMNFRDRYYLGLAMQRAGRVEEAVAMLESFLEHVEKLRADGTTSEDLGLKDGFDMWVFRANDCLSRIRTEIDAADKAARVRDETK